VLKEVLRSFFKHFEKRSGQSCPLPARVTFIYLVCYLVALLKSFHPSGGVYHSTLTAKKRVALTAQLNLERFSSRTNGKGITARADHFGISMVFGMNLIFHNNI
jgi:hypothetical protein